MRFTLRQLSYFIAAGESGSVTRAAAIVNISQPSVSAAISHLEKEFGVQLFVRLHAQGLALTPAGNQFLKAAKETVRSANDLYEVASSSASKVSGPISIGAFRTFAPLVVPEIWRSFGALYPDVKVQITIGSEATLLDGLRRAQIDVALTYNLHLGDDMEFRPLAELPTYVLLAADHPLAGRASLSLQALVGEPFILLDLPLSRQYFLSLFDAEKIEPYIAIETPDTAMLRSFVAAGIGYSLLTARPLNTHAENDRPLVYVPLEGDNPPMVIGLASLKGLRRTRLVAAFEDHCQTVTLPGSIPGMSPFGPATPRKS